MKFYDFIKGIIVHGGCLVLMALCILLATRATPSAAAMDISRRNLLILGGTTMAAAVIKPTPVLSPQPLSQAELIRRLLDAAAEIDFSLAIRLGQLLSLQGLIPQTLDAEQSEILRRMQDRAVPPSREQLYEEALRDAGFNFQMPRAVTWERSEGFTLDGRIFKGLARRVLITRFTQIERIVSAAASAGRVLRPQDVDQALIAPSTECDLPLLPGSEEGFVMISNAPKEDE
jgi:hypothetical protein